METLALTALIYLIKSANVTEEQSLALELDA